MSDTDSQTIWEMVGMTESLVKALNIESCAEGTQAAILEKFSDYVFKHVLLRVPAEHAMEVREVVEGAGPEHEMEDLIAVLARYIPNPRVAVEEEITNAIQKFRVT